MSARPRTSAHRARTGAAAALAALLLTGCGAGPVRAGAAATVGDERIDTTTLTAVVERGLSDTEAEQQFGADRPAFERSVLSRLISGFLLEEAAERQGVSIDKGEIDARYAALSAQLGGDEALLQQAADAGVSEQDLRPFVRDLALGDKLGDQLTKDVPVPAAVLQQAYQQEIANYDKVVARHILLETQAEAQQVLAAVRADENRFAALASARSLDEGSKADGGRLPATGPGGFVEPFSDALFAAEEGELGIVQTEFGWHVYQLLERDTTTLAQATPELRRQILAEQRSEATAELLREVSNDLGVKVNPRFGGWSTEQVSVVERDSPLSSPAAGGDLPLEPGAGAPPVEGAPPAEGAPPVEGAPPAGQ